MNFPENLKYTKDHEWMLVRATRGPWGSPNMRRESWATWCSSSCRRWGRALKAGESFGTIEAVKAVSDLYAPVSGR